MTDNALKETVIRLAEPVAHALGLVIWGVEITRAGRTVVRLFVDVPASRSGSGLPEESIPQQAARQDGGLGLPLHEVDVSSAPHSATLHQCEEISRHLGLALEVEDSIPEAYVLEVSTPGLTRLFFSLAQMRPYLGDVVEARLHAPVAPGLPAEAESGAPRRLWRGRLTAVEDDAFVLAPVDVSAEGEVRAEQLPPVRLPWEAVRRASRIYVFRQPAKPGKGPATGPGKNAARTLGKKAGKKTGKTPADNENTAG